MNRLFNHWGKLLPFLFVFLLSSQIFGAVGEVLEVDGKEVIIEGKKTVLVSVGNWLTIYDFNDKKVGKVVVKEVNVSENSIEYVCEIHSGTTDIRVGFVVRHDKGEVGAYYLELNQLDMQLKQNNTYYELTGSDPSLGYGDAYIIRVGNNGMGEYGKNTQTFGSLSTSYMVLGPLNIWSIFEVGFWSKLTLKKSSTYVSIGGLIGVGKAYGEINWARPDGIYDDGFDIFSGKAKTGVVFPFQWTTSFIYNLSPEFGLQFNVGYLGMFWGNRFKDTENSDFVIEKEWHEVEIEHGILIGLTLNVNYF